MRSVAHLARGARRAAAATVSSSGTVARTGARPAAQPIVRPHLAARIACRPLCADAKNQWVYNKSWGEYDARDLTESYRRKFGVKPHPPKWTSNRVTHGQPKYHRTPLSERIVHLASRSVEGSRPSNRERRAGRIPGLVYGGGPETERPKVLITADALELERMCKVYKSSLENTIFKIHVDGSDECEFVLPRGLQRHSVTNEIVSLNWMRLAPPPADYAYPGDDNFKLQRKHTRLHTFNVSIPIAVADQEQSPGLKRGGYLNMVNWSLPCTVDLRLLNDGGVNQENAEAEMDIPSNFLVSVDGFEVKDQVRAYNLELPAGVVPDPKRTQGLETFIFSVLGKKAPKADGGGGDDDEDDEIIM